MASFSFALSSGHRTARSGGGSGGTALRGLGWELLPMAPSSMPAPSRLLGDRHEPVHEPEDSPGQATQFGSNSAAPVWRHLPSNKMILPMQPTTRLRTHSSTLQSNLTTAAPTPRRLSSAGSLQHLLPPLTLDHEITTPVLRQRKQVAPVSITSPSIPKKRQLPERQRDTKPETTRASSPAVSNPAVARGVSSICLRLPVPACLSPGMTRLYGMFNSWRLHTADAQSWRMLVVASVCALLLGFLLFESCLVLVACVLVIRGIQLTVTFHFHKSPHHRKARSLHSTNAARATTGSSPSESSESSSESATPAMDTPDLPLPRDSPAPLASCTPTLSDPTVLASMHQQASKLMALDALAKPSSSTPIATTESIEVRPFQQQRSSQPLGGETQAPNESDSCSGHSVLSHASFSSSSPLLADPLLRTVHPFFQGRAQLVGWLDHAIRNPLHAIIASADLLRSNSAEPENEDGSESTAKTSSLADSDLECLTAIVDAATNIQEILMSLQQLASTCVDPDAGLSTGGELSAMESKHVSPTPPGLLLSNETSPEKEASSQAHEERKQLEVGEGSLIWPNASSSATATADPAAPTWPRTQPPLSLPRSNLVSPAVSALVTREHSPRDAVDAAARAFDAELNVHLMSPHGSTSVPSALPRRPSAEGANSNMLPPTHNKTHSLSAAASAVANGGVDFSTSVPSGGATVSSGSWSFPASIPAVASASTPPLPIFNPLTNLRSQPSTPVTAKRRLTMRSEMMPPLTSPPASITTAAESEGAAAAAVAVSSSSASAIPPVRPLDVQRPALLQHATREPPTSCASVSPAQVTPVVVVPQVGVRTPPMSRATVEPEPSPAQPQQPPQPQPVDYRSCRVLVVDDSPINVKILSRMLSGLGLSVYTAADGLQAVEAVQKLAAVTTHAAKEKRKQRHTKRQQHLAATQAAAADREAASTQASSAAASAPPVTPIMHAQETMAQRSFSAHAPQQPSFLRVPHSAHASSSNAGAQTRGSSDDGSSSQSRAGSGSESVSPASSPAPSPSLAPVNSPASSTGVRKGTWRAKRHFDIILSDVNMPLMNGLESSIKIRELEQMHGLPRVPIIAVTANSSLEDRAACADAGMNYFVQKPFVRNDIIVLVQQILQAQQQQQQQQDLDQITSAADTAASAVGLNPPQVLAPLLPPLQTGAAHTRHMMAALAAAANDESADSTAASAAPPTSTVSPLLDPQPASVVSAPTRPLSRFDSSSPDLNLTRCVSDHTAERWVGSPSHVTMDSASLQSSSSAASAARSDLGASDSAPSSSSTSSGMISPTPCLPMSPLRQSPAHPTQRYRSLGLKGGSKPADV